MTAQNVTSSTDSQMHNNIMAAGSRDRPPMLAPGQYPQWRSRFLRYDVKKNLFWEFGKFTSRDGETMESYYTRFYNLMNEMMRNNLTVTTMQVNVQFLQQLQLEWSRHKGKEIAKPITTPSETAFEEDNNPEQAQRDKDMQKNLALIAKNQRTVNVAGAREKAGSPVVQQSGIQCFNCKEYGHYAKECRKPKRVKDPAYHKEKMLLCKQAEQEPVEQVQNDVGYNVFANELQHSEQSEYVSNTRLVETDDSNVTPDSPDMCEDAIRNDQNDAKSDDERVALDNLKLDVDEKKIQKQLKKANTTLAQELKECKTILAETSKSLGESISVRDSFLVALQTKQAEFEKYKAFNDCTIDYDKLERKLNETLGQLTLKDIEIKEGLKTKAYEISVVKQKHDELMKQSLLTKSHYEGLVKQ
nr:hypothetical protein [Tanacetum cinerariifolium]